MALGPLENAILEAYAAGQTGWTITGAEKVLHPNPKRVFLMIRNGHSSVPLFVKLGGSEPTEVGDGFLLGDALTGHNEFQVDGPHCWKGSVWIFTTAESGLITVTEYNESAGEIVVK